MTQEFATMKDDLEAVYGPGEPPVKGPSIADLVRSGAKAGGMTRAQWSVTRDALAAMASRIEAMSPACSKCIYLDANHWCARWESKPPQEFLAQGCDEWIHDGVPF